MHRAARRRGQPVERRVTIRDMSAPSTPAVTPPLIVTRDRSLLDEILRLAAAAGITPEVAPDAGSALRQWPRAPLVLVGADVAEELARIAPARRPGVHLVAWGEVRDDLFRTALEVGAESVAQLPRSEEWLTELLTDLGEADRPAGVVIGVIGGSGGAGATTFACALGQLAARRGRTAVIDADPLGPGVDRVLGVEDRAGVRWDGLCQTTGRLSARALREALPRRHDLGVLSWRAGAPGSLQAFAVREVLSAARRGHDYVFLDLPRSPDPLVSELVDRCDRLLVVTVPTVPGVAAAARVCARYPAPADLRLVVRGHGVDLRALEETTRVPVIAQMNEQRGLLEAVDLGLGPVRSRRGTLGKAASAVLDHVSLLRGRDAA